MLGGMETDLFRDSLKSSIEVVKTIETSFIEKEKFLEDCKWIKQEMDSSTVLLVHGLKERNMFEKNDIRENVIMFYSVRLVNAGEIFKIVRPAKWLFALFYRYFEVYHDEANSSKGILRRDLRFCHLSSAYLAILSKRPLDTLL